MIVRPASAAGRPAWAAMRQRLWPDSEAEELERDPPSAFVAERDGRLIGFAEASVRSVAEGAPSDPAAYLEGIWVEPEDRRRGVGRALLAAVEAWARDQGLAWLGSDALLDNGDSHRWHLAAGFGEVERLVVFGKPLGRRGEAGDG
ncbi:MAG TPA: GNAT family N-acetyltransferase [Allosphingosinicella sp.]|jgi:aminoglycoside 6'-N-acetyltransferase I